MSIGVVGGCLGRIGLDLLGLTDCSPNSSLVALIAAVEVAYIVAVTVVTVPGNPECMHKRVLHCSKVGLIGEAVVTADCHIHSHNKVVGRVQLKVKS